MVSDDFIIMVYITRTHHSCLICNCSCIPPHPLNWQHPCAHRGGRYGSEESDNFNYDSLVGGGGGVDFNLGGHPLCLCTRLFP